MALAVSTTSLPACGRTVATTARVVRERTRAVRSVAIVGGGPAGAMLGFELARAGVQVAMFAPDNRPPLVVGESLVPAIVPFLRRLGIENEVAGFSVPKPGATFTLRGQEPLSFRFADFKRIAAPYAYNSPRDLLDAAIRRAAIGAGVRVFPFAAKLERVGDDGLRLAAETLRATDGFFLEGPDWIVDASGRRRLVSNLLDLPSRAGPRRDAALFAHLEGMPLVHAGHAHSDLLDHGWCWRIPLRGKVSLGMVVHGDTLGKFGAGNEEQYDNFLRQDTQLRSFGGAPKRVSPVMRYTNYQMLTQRGVGAGWALVGDAFGFVDPVFSSGLLVSLDGAVHLAAALVEGSGAALAAYEQRVLRHVAAWHRAVDRFYDGRLLTLFQMGVDARRRVVGRLLNLHFSRHFPQLFTGDATLRRYSSWLLEFMCKRGLAKRDPALLRVLA
ncbi:MAG: tryptophan 7-halogenase [Planctomycetota bacterium]